MLEDSHIYRFNTNETIEKGLPINIELMEYQLKTALEGSAAKKLFIDAQKIKLDSLSTPEL